MARQVNQVLWDQWRQRIDRQRTSGLSIAEFCRKERLSPHGFYVWRRKVHRTTSSRPKTAVPRRLRKRRSGWTPRQRPCPSPVDLFGSVRPSEFLQLPVTAMRPSPWVELSLADGTVVRLPQQNLTALVTVLRVLRGEPLDLPNAERGHA